MTQRFPQIESTIDAVVGDFNVRLWINHKAIPNDLRREQELHNRLIRLTGYKMPNLIRRIIEDVPNLNAIQVRDGIVGTIVHITEFNKEEHE